MKKKVEIENQINLFGDIKKTEKGTEQKTSIKERVEKYGVNTLLDHEIISMLTGIDLDIIRKHVNDFGLIEIIQYKNALNLSPAQRRKLELLYVFMERIYTTKNKEKIMLDTSQKAGNYCINLFKNRVREIFIVVSVNAQNMVLFADLVHEGTIAECCIYPRSIIESALKYNATSVIFSHNHPGGSLKPSKADIDVTKKLKTSLESIDIKVLDHIIVGGDNFFSFSENGYL